MFIAYILLYVIIILNIFYIDNGNESLLYLNNNF